MQRHFARLQLSSRPDGTAPKAFGRFEAAACDELWVSDGLHGPILDGRRAVLFALLDDHSRYVVGHRWGHGEDTLGMQAALHDAVKTHGCPQRLYCDNGSRLLLTPAGLVGSGAGHQARAPARKTWGGARSNAGTAPCVISSWWRSTPTGADPRRAQPAVHRVVPPALPPRRALRNRTTPAQRYHAEGRDRPPTPDPALLRRAFLWREQRKVTAFATVSCTATATRSTPLWSAAPSTCCSPRST